MEFWRPRTIEEADRGLRCLVAGPEARPTAVLAGEMRGELIESQLAQFKAYAVGIGIDTRRQVMAVEVTEAGPRVLAMCLWVPAPGRTAMLFGPNLSEFPAAAAPLEAGVREALKDAQSDGVVLVQVMMDPHDPVGLKVFENAGLQSLATLEFMERRPPIMVPTMDLPAGLRLESYSQANHGLFREAILGSYEQTLDCPELSDMRDIEDVITGHKAVGNFEEDLWTLVLERDHPIGCLLLAEIVQRRALDLVYLGLAPAGRGRGLGRAMMQRLLATATRRGLALVSLAVDERNTPAQRLYRRFGLAVVARRTALVKKLDKK